MTPNDSHLFKIREYSHYECFFQYLVYFFLTKELRPEKKYILGCAQPCSQTQPHKPLIVVVIVFSTFQVKSAFVFTLLLKWLPD